MKQVNELLQGIKLLKLYGWEDLYCKGVEVIRGKQLRSLLTVSAGLVFTSERIVSNSKCPLFCLPVSVNVLIGDEFAVFIIIGFLKEHVILKRKSRIGNS